VRHVDDVVDHALQVRVRPRDHSHEEIALTGRGVHLAHLGDRSQALAHLGPPALRDLDDRERRQPVAHRAEVQRRREPGEHAAFDETVQPRLHRSACDAQPAGAFEDAETWLVGEEQQQPRVQFVHRLVRVLTLLI
jgi:hypothetical protein